MNNNLCMRFQLLHRFAGMSSRQRARTAEELLTARQLPPLPDIADAPPIGLADLYRDGTQKGKYFVDNISNQTWFGVFQLFGAFIRHPIDSCPVFKIPFLFHSTTDSS